jgi:hypothetical protein
MPTFNIPEDAFTITRTTLASSSPPAAPLPVLSPGARNALEAGEPHVQPTAQIAMRRVTADRAVTKELRDWFIQVEDLLQASANDKDRAGVPTCRAAANALIRAFATGSDGPPPKARR